MSEKLKPETFKDLKWMQLTAGGHGKETLEHRVVNENAAVGEIESVSVCVKIHQNYVDVIQYENVVTEVYSDTARPGGRHSFTESTSRVIETYNSMEELERSRWFKKMMLCWSIGDVDASWLDSFTVNGQTIQNDERWGWSDGFEEEFNIEISEQVKSCLGNLRQSRQHSPVNISVSRLSGELTILYRDYRVQGTVSEIVDAMRIVKALKSKGINFEDNILTVDFEAEC